MENYAKLYHLLFNAITDALEQMESQNYGNAKDMLIAAGAASLPDCWLERKKQTKSPRLSARAFCCVVCVFLGGRKSHRGSSPLQVLR